MNSNLLPLFRGRRTLPFLIPVALFLFSACATNNPQDTFDTAGPVADEQAGLFKLIFWIAVVVFIIVEGGIIWITIKYRRRSDSAMPEQTHGNTKLELTWTVIPALIIVAIAIPTVASIWDLAEPPADEPVMTVEAIGHQWWFEFRYPGEELVTANELVVPVGRNVIVELDSQDVIHSFWVPKLFGKVDMVPNRDNQLWFRADEAGNFWGQCAEFCGTAHALMRFRVIAMEEPDYLEWVAGMRRPPAAPSGGAADGQALFAQNCATCHTTDTWRAGGYSQEITLQETRWNGWLADIDNSRIVSAPNLTHFATRTTLGAGIADLDRAALIEWITDPGSIKPGTHMQDHAAVYQTDDDTANLTQAEIESIADFLLSLVPGEADAEPTPTPGGGGDPVAVGEAVFTTNCTSCHSTGDNTQAGPGLAGISERAGSRVEGLGADEYIEQSIRQPNSYVVDDFQAIMPTLPLSDEEIAGLVAYLNTLE